MCLLLSGATPASDMSTGNQLRQPVGRLVRHRRQPFPRDRHLAGRFARWSVQRQLRGGSRWRQGRISATDTRRRARLALRCFRRSAEYRQHHRRTGNIIPSFDFFCGDLAWHLLTDYIVDRHWVQNIWLGPIAHAVQHKLECIRYPAMLSLP